MALHTGSGNLKNKGFTLIELMVVMSIIALLLTIALPRYIKTLDKSREVALRQNLHQMRDALDKYYGDKGKYPESLEDLVLQHYLKNIPPDPMTDSTTTWVAIPPPDAMPGAVYDIKSGAQGKAYDQTTFSEW